MARAAAVLLCLALASPALGARRFSGRVQILSGAGLALPAGDGGGRRLVSYVPLDVELGLHLSGPVSVVAGGVGYLSPFTLPGCPGEEGSRPAALAGFAGVRLDLNNSNRGSWLSPWLALRGGVVGQARPIEGPTGCAQVLGVAPWFGPRLGLDLWLGRAAATFAVGYDHLPAQPALSAQVGLTLRLY